MTDLAKHAHDIYDQLPDGAAVDTDDIEERLDTLVTEYKVSIEEARRSLLSTDLDETEADRNDYHRDTQQVNLADIDEPDQWMDVIAKVVQLWEPRSDAVRQVGLLGDESGTIKFTKWAKSDLAEFVEGRVNRLGNVVTDEYNRCYSLKLNRTTTIEKKETDIEVGDNSIVHARSI